MGSGSNTNSLCSFLNSVHPDSQESKFGLSFRYSSADSARLIAASMRKVENTSLAVVPVLSSLQRSV